MSDNVIGGLAVAFRLCCCPGPLQSLPRFLGRLREGGNERGTEDQPAHRRGQPVHHVSSVMRREGAPVFLRPSGAADSPAGVSRGWPESSAPPAGPARVGAGESFRQQCWRTVA